MWQLSKETWANKVFITRRRLCWEIRWRQAHPSSSHTATRVIPLQIRQWIWTGIQMCNIKTSFFQWGVSRLHRQYNLHLLIIRLLDAGRFKSQLFYLNSICRYVNINFNMGVLELITCTARTCSSLIAVSSLIRVCSIQQSSKDYRQKSVQNGIHLKFFGPKF